MNVSMYEKNKDQLIADLLQLQVYKMPDGRQFYEASENELKIQFKRNKQRLENSNDIA